MDTLLFTLTSEGYISLTENFLISAKKSNVQGDILVFCVDNKSNQYFKEKGYNTLRLDVSKYLPLDNYDIMDYGSTYFQKLTYFKLVAMELLLNSLPKTIRYLIYIDGDIIIFKDFIPYIKDICKNSNLPAYIFQVDEERIDISHELSIHLCTGVMIVDREKHSTNSSPFKLNDSHWENPALEDQAYLSYKLRKDKIPYYLLDRDLFPNGVFLKHPDILAKKTPYLLHYNWMMSNEKEIKMKQNNHWLLN